MAVGLWLAPATARALTPDLEPNNLALWQLTGQSSSLYGDDSWIAVDGDDGGDWNLGTATLTDQDFHAWWEVDLGVSRHIGSIEINQRTDCCQDDIFPFMVIVADFPIIDTDITDADGATFPGITRIIVSDPVQTHYVIPVHRTGEFVRIALLREYTSLSLGEVKVFEEPNALLGRSGIAGANAGNAIDGNVDGYQADGSTSVTSSTSSTKAWWEGDMRVPRPINTVDVWSTNTDCCSTLNPPAKFTLYASQSQFVFDPSKAANRPAGTLVLTGNVQGAPATVNLGGFKAQYIAIQVETKDALSLAEVQAWPMADGSAGAQPTLSSKFSSSSDPFAAVDLNPARAGNDVNLIDTKTASQTDPFYELDLGSDRYIETVKLWNQAGLSSNTSYSLFVSEFNPIPATVAQIRANQAALGIVEFKNVGTAADSTTAIRERARWLRVQLVGANQSLGFNEMEIYTPEGLVTSPGQGSSIVSFSTSVKASGFHTRPNELIDLYALAPGFTTGGGFYNNWEFLGTGTSSNVPQITTVAVAPMYPWTISNAFIPAGLVTKGGLMGLYAQAEVNPGPGTIMEPLRALNADYVSNTNGVVDYWDLIQSADVYGPHFSLASNEITPDTKPTPPPYLLKPMGTAVNTSYYNLRSVGTYKEIPATLALFNSQYGLGSGTNVRYYNKGDLGIGRNMTCARPTWSAGGTSVKGIACAVSNYAPAAPAGSKAPVVFGDRDNSLSLMKNNKPAFATVVMVKRDGSNTTMFGVYQPNTTPATTDPTKTKLIQSQVFLDSTGFNQAVPNNCMACHGGSGGGDPLSQTMQTAFLPFDINAMNFDVSPYDYGTQAEKFRTLNNYISLSSPTPAVADFIKGSYHNAVGTAGTKFDFTYRPAGWSHSTAQSNVYDRVIRPYCRACHMSQVQGVNNGFDMLKASDLDNIRALVLSDVCKAHIMPHSQLTMQKTWNSDARTTLVSYFGRDDVDSATLSASLCTP